MGFIHTSQIKLNPILGEDQLLPSLCFLYCSVLTQLCLTLFKPVDHSPPDSSVHGFPRQEYWSGLPFLLQGIFLTQGSNLHLLHWQADSLPLSHLGNPVPPLALWFSSEF